MVLKSRVLAPDWTAGGDPDKEAKCRKVPLPKNNNPTPYSDPFFLDEAEARHVCNGTYDGYVCPFRDVCLHRALVNNEQAGTFGGLTVEQRRWVRRHSRRTVPLPEPFIGRDKWDSPDEWRHLVPEPEFFEQEEDDDDEESTEEYSA